MNILIDTSVWIDYFRSGAKTNYLDFLIEENLISTNALILTELIPFLKIKGQSKLIGLLEKIRKLELNINWHEIVGFQFKCLKSGINGVGIPDLIIAQNAIQNDVPLCSLDGHFFQIASKIKLKIFNEKNT
ncbi:MAG: hypothetical protein ACD_28C00344G0001 [uncultured bacterium]|nr:MAG: hypothetical protein ACD_28C00344G0001 [uncultured bacterium]